MILLGSVIFIVGVVSLLLGHFVYKDITRYLKFSVFCSLLGLGLISVELKLQGY